jgi:uncharacterized protein YhaN
MRFARLDLLKYGRFDNCSFSFPEGSPDLHIIFGPNEAGKSTTMSAISDLLFEFGHTTAFDVLHDKQLLRVGAVLSKDGSELTCRRKKGCSSTLIDSQERPLDEGLLAAFLAGQTRESFHRMFSLDHARLREGGKAILEAKDDVGQAIFAAGSGLIGISATLEELEQETKQIWTKRSGNQDYHLAQRSFEEARSRFKAAQIKPAAWGQLREELEKLDEQIQGLRDSRRSKETEREHIERRRRTLAPIALLRQAEAELEAVAGTPELPANAAEILEEASNEVATARTEAQLAKGQMQAANDALAEIVFEPALLERHAEFEELREEKGAVNKSLSDLPRRQTELKGAERGLEGIQAEIGWPKEPADKASERLPRHVDIAELRDLLEKRTARDAVLVAAIDSQTTCDEEATKAKSDLDQLAPAMNVKALSAALQMALSAGDLDVTVTSAKLTLKRRRDALNLAIGKLTPWSGGEESLEALLLPTEAETAEASSAQDQIQEALTKARGTLNAETERHASFDLQRRQIYRDDGAVSPQEVQDSRDIRNAAWEVIREHFVSGVALANPGPVAVDFARKLSDADELADKRYAAAEQSGRLAGLIEELERISLSVTQQESRIELAEARAVELVAEWKCKLAEAGLELLPKEFVGWRERYARALEALSKLKETEDELAAQTAKRDDTKTLVAGEIAALDSDFDPLLDHSYAYLLQRAQQLKSVAELAEKQRIKLSAALVSASNAVDRANEKKTLAESKIEEWKTAWIPAVRRSGLDADNSIAVIRAQLDLLEQARSRIEEIVGLQRRIATMEGDIASFGQRVIAMAESCGVFSEGLEPGAVLDTLSAHISKAVTLSERKTGLEKQVEDAKKREEVANETRTLAEARLAPLLKAAGLTDYELLYPVIEKATQARTLKEKVAQLEEQIVQIGEGIPLETLLSDSEGADSASLKSKSDELKEESLSLSDEIERLGKRHATATVEFEALNDGPDATTAAADMELARAEMSAQAERYLRKRSQTTLLGWAIERYRAEKQTPLLKRASELFSTLTLGRYSTLLVDQENNDSRLSALTTDSTVVPVTGMSEGTVDQLFLSLRLAALEDAVIGGVRLPFLADDLFINYDDERAKAGFKVLAEVANTTQVLFFTHHRHLLPIARNSIAPSVLSECTIPS